MENIELNDVSAENNKGERIIAGFVIAVALFFIVCYVMLRVQEGESQRAYNENRKESYNLLERYTDNDGWETIDTIRSSSHFIMGWDAADDTVWHTIRMKADTSDTDTARVQIYYYKAK